MNQQHTPPGIETERTDHAPRPEPGPDPPHIYVASLSDYNSGWLHGAWIEATDDEIEMGELIGNMLAASRQPGAEEYAIHDHMGFGDWWPSEFESLSIIARVARGIQSHGLAFTSWIDYCGDVDAADDSFDQAFRGVWSSMHGYAEHLLEEIGVTLRVEPASFETYIRIDTEALARDLDIELYSCETENGAWVFDPSALR